MVARDQMVGPWQVPVADCAVTTASLDSYYGEAMSIGERAGGAAGLAASARLAVGEALTNIAATQIGDIKRIKLSANWMAAAGHLAKMPVYMTRLKRWERNSVRSLA